MTAAAGLAFAIQPLLRHLLCDVLNENRDALGDSRKSPANSGDDPIDVAQAGAGAHLELFIEFRLSRFRDMTHHAIEIGDDFVDTQSDETSIGRDFPEEAREIREARIGQLETQLVR